MLAESEAATQAKRFRGARAILLSVFATARWQLPTSTPSLSANEMGCRTGFDPVPPASQARMLNHHTHDTINAEERRSTQRKFKALRLGKQGRRAIQQRTYTIPPVPLRTLPTCFAGILGLQPGHLRGGLRRIIGPTLVALRRIK